MKVIRRVLIHGKVQGVGFRYWTQIAAHGHSLAGWVRNRRDGSVEALFAGPAEAVAAMIEACKSGPSSSRVTRVEQFDAIEAELSLRGAGEGFVSLPTL